MKAFLPTIKIGCKNSFISAMTSLAAKKCDSIESTAQYLELTWRSDLNKNEMNWSISHTMDDD